MFAKFKIYLFETEYVLLATILVLACIGIFSIYSAILDNSTKSRLLKIQKNDIIFYIN